MSHLNFYWLWLAANPLFILAVFLVLRAPFTHKADRVTNWAGSLIKGMDQISETTIALVKWFALGMVLITTALVLGRYVFGVGSLKGQEAVIYMHGLLFLLSAAATLLHNGHVRVDVVYSRLSTANKAWVDLLGTGLFLIPVCLVILIFSDGYVARAWQITEGSPEVDGLPWVYLLKSVIPVFAIMVLLQGSAQSLRAALTLAGHPLPAAKAHAEMI
ncbi:MAG: hypothetical protein COA47_04245 [Robiginitomaculum sp.]|nr:MAG: hypothetical protein COA47_04245 [Robiginitomaculum sp.]